MLTPHLNLKQGSICERRPVDFNSAPHSISVFQLCFKLWFKWCGLLLLLLLTLSSSFMLWAELLEPSESMYSSWSIDYNGGSSAPLKYDWNLSAYLNSVCLCFEFNMLPSQTRTWSCFSDIKWSEGGALFQFRFCNLRVIWLWYECPQLFNPVVDVVSSSSFN